MFAYIRPIFAATLALALVSAPAVRAQDGQTGTDTQDGQTTPAIDPARVLATVNGTGITLAHVIAVRQQLPRQYDQFPAAVLFQGVLDQLIQQTLLMQSFEGKLPRSAKTQLENARRDIYATEVVKAVIADGLDEADLREAYEAQYPANADQQEYRAAHILVDSEKAAQQIVADLADGAEFAALARDKSTGPSASVGGDLGWFGEGDMVPEFFDAVAALAPGEVSAPVKTDFGWHVIKLDELREKQRPAFEDVRAELENKLRQSLLEAHVAKLAEKATVDRADLADFDPEAINADPASGN